MLRPRFLAKAGVLASGILLAGRDSNAQTPATNPRRVDVHHHYLPPDWAALLASKNLLTRQRIGWTPAKSIEAMDRTGVATAILSTTPNQNLPYGLDEKVATPCAPVLGSSMSMGRCWSRNTRVVSACSPPYRSPTSMRPCATSSTRSTCSRPTASAWSRATATSGSAIQRLPRRRFYYDTAATANPVAMGALRQVVPVSQIVFGTDFPYSTMVNILKGLQECGVFGADDLHAVGRENALTFLPRYAA